MATTNAAIRAAQKVLLGRVAKRYPCARNALIRVAIEYAKQGGEIERDAVRSILQAAYEVLHGVSPIGKHRFRHFLHEALSDVDTETPTVNADDLYDAVEIEVV